ncbi:hypothetical protein PNOK_0119900 [Pyrrhoderma noxium]|uniref:Uncharacterized protein n=1 Tax=Pyrrhoderma noxium TaxID=2282107 RepID=A0A286UX39_9AGAM|nr:hypothetical protein PNOK_0119900 [Pyrrhoderma noxium]
MQRSTSTISVSYECDNSGMDSEICTMLGSLSLRGWSFEQEQAAKAKQLVVEDTRPQTITYSNDVESDAIMEITDVEGNVQFIDMRTSQVEPQEKGCGLLHILASHYHPSSAACGTQDPDFNLLDTILAHREAFVAFPRAHRTCSAALTDIAFALERKHNSQMPYKGDEADLDTAVALHNEAWLMSGWYST